MKWYEIVGLIGSICSIITFILALVPLIKYIYNNLYDYYIYKKYLIKGLKENGFSKIYNYYLKCSLEKRNKIRRANNKFNYITKDIIEYGIFNFIDNLEELKKKINELENKGD